MTAMRNRNTAILAVSSGGHLACTLGLEAALHRSSLCYAAVECAFSARLFKSGKHFFDQRVAR